MLQRLLRLTCGLVGAMLLKLRLLVKLRLLWLATGAPHSCSGPQRRILYDSNGLSPPKAMAQNALPFRQATPRAPSPVRVAIEAALALPVARLNAPNRDAGRILRTPNGSRRVRLARNHGLELADPFT